MTDAATNLPTIVADSVSIWSAAAKDTLDLHQIFIGHGAVVEPVIVSKPNADAVEHELQYAAPGPGQVPKLDGVVNYISQETAKQGTVVKNYSTTRTQYYFNETYSPLIYQKIKR